MVVRLPVCHFERSNMHPLTYIATGASVVAAPISTGVADAANGTTATGKKGKGAGAKVG